jgi:hypothetical protein
MTFRAELIQVAAVAVAIVQDLDHGTTDPRHEGRFPVLRTLEEVNTERYRQEMKWGPQHHTPEEWLAILTEEVGEAAAEVGVLGAEAQSFQGALLDAEHFARAFLKERFDQAALS